MKKSVERMKSEFASLRTGRVSLALFEGIRVNAYGKPMPINQLATLGLPDVRTIEMRPWDPSVGPEIEKAIASSNLGLVPMNDGKVIRVTLPPLSEERRKELVRVVKKMAEEFRVALRRERQEAVEKLKKAEKTRELSEDDRFHGDHQVQKLTDTYIKKVDEILIAKEKEIMEV